MIIIQLIDGNIFTCVNFIFICKNCTRKAEFFSDAFCNIDGAILSVEMLLF